MKPVKKFQSILVLLVLFLKKEENFSMYYFKMTFVCFLLTLLAFQTSSGMGKAPPIGYHENWFGREFNFDLEGTGMSGDAIYHKLPSGEEYMSFSVISPHLQKEPPANPFEDIPETPGMLLPLKKSNSYIGGLYSSFSLPELYFLTAFHVVKNLSKKDLKKALDDEGLEFENFSFYRIRNKDLFFAVPKGIEKRELISDFFYTLTETPRLNQPYFSVQFGSVGTENFVQQLSKGYVPQSDVDEEGFYFLSSNAAQNSNEPQNYTSSGSSGSLVFLKKQGRWNLNGVIQCFVPANEGYHTQGSIRVIDLYSLFSNLRERELIELDFSSPFSVRERDPVWQEPVYRDCEPIDRRGGGGFNKAGEY